MTVPRACFSPHPRRTETQSPPHSTWGRSRYTPGQSPRIAPRKTASSSPAYSRVPMPEMDTHKKTGVTFAHQDQLPKLPIPGLDATCQRYLEALKPLQTPREQIETQHAVREFLENDGPGLQEKLKKYAHDKTSYIEQFWYDSYLNYDNPVVLNLNPFFLLEDDPTPARENRVTGEASLVVSALEFIRAVRNEELPPDTIKGKPLCMYQFSRLFGTARVPTDNGCQIVQDPQSKHIAVVCHGQLYWFDVLDDNSDVIMTERDIAVNLQTIAKDASHTPIQSAAKDTIGVLTTENRKIWAGLRDVLARDPASNNAECLQTVDSALFVLCLDYTEPANVAALRQNMFCGTSKVRNGVQIGTCTNRWYDKMQIIVCKNGSAGINFEHTSVDGHTVLRFASDVYTDTILRIARSINGQAPSLWTSTSPDPAKRDPESFGNVNTTPRKLEWDMIPELSIAVRFAETRLADLIEQNEFQCLDFGSYGKNLITCMGFSPDAFIQMAFQAAYYGLYGRFECTYEPAMTKFFLHGRTEAIRTVTDECVDFVQTFWADNPPAKIDALKRACQSHVKRTRECAQAQGCDRHLYALLCVWQKHVDEVLDDNMSSFSQSSSADTCSVQSFGQESSDTVHINSARNHHNGAHARLWDTHPLPFLFVDSGWDKLNTTKLSTSNCGNPSLRHFGFGPTSADGFGIGYIIKDESISICVSSKYRQTKRFVDAIESYLLEIRRILRLSNRQLSNIKSSRAREAESARPEPATTTKPCGRSIGNAGPSPDSGAVAKPDAVAQEDDDELGGYGFFDAGMLLQALQGRSNGADTSETKSSEPPAVQARRRQVGKKLRLATE